ncbi:hypothetical protein M1L60_17435 [Actinoplanes sp. TRM 88003]|uniref:Transmembrane protein n=1 Tax=Paractinoplanes aksuensis TaxID=2939490 RepID=A0ABT1DQU0_9ACTN|nr:hypothetical protein [Actinoplanes aksuensis]MCO8272380.1 hypothetical protein [Actinoplanes aksuensis]
MPEAAEDEELGFVASAAATLRLILGWALVALGLLNLAMGLTDGPYVVFHAVLLVTGLLLLSAGRSLGPVSRLAWLAGGLTAGLGLVVSAVPALTVACCSRGYAVRHGFPFTMLARDPGGWRFDLVRTLADLLFWLCAGLIVLVAAARLRPARDTAAPRPPTSHSEARNAGHHRSQSYDETAGDGAEASREMS